jgi:hypothetical protein
MPCNRFPPHDASIDRHGANTSSSGANAAAGRGARSTGAPDQGGRFPTEITRSDPLHGAHGREW